jgi:hypothetical protein
MMCSLGHVRNGDAERLLGSPLGTNPVLVPESPGIAWKRTAIAGDCVNKQAAR